LRVRHRLDSRDVYCAHVFDHAEDPHELLEHLIGLGLIDRDAGKACSAFDVIAY
jgi:hypothetical protein